ncbi:MAG TPA: hypothetical protein DEQ40_10425 [Oxalobacteraceae bacterium]|jgi:hypothetical protein|nr:hypothetical protein [Oxalobacteraceae bacterium]
MVDIFLKGSLIRERGVMFVMHSVFVSFAGAWYVLPIILAVYGSSVFAKAIENPSFIKASLIEPSEVLAKFSDSGLQGGKLCLKNINYFDGIDRPLDWRWIESFKFSTNGRSENESCRDTTRATFSPKSEPMGNEPRKAAASSSKEPPVSLRKIEIEKIHPSILLLVAVIVISLFYDKTNYSMKPNE